MRRGEGVARGEVVIDLIVAAAVSGRRRPAVLQGRERGADDGVGRDVACRPGGAVGKLDGAEGRGVHDGEAVGAAGEGEHQAATKLIDLRDRRCDRGAEIDLVGAVLGIGEDDVVAVAQVVLEDFAASADQDIVPGAAVYRVVRQVPIGEAVRVDEVAARRARLDDV